MRIIIHKLRKEFKKKFVLLIFETESKLMKGLKKFFNGLPRFNVPSEIQRVNNYKFSID